MAIKRQSETVDEMMLEITAGSPHVLIKNDGRGVIVVERVNRFDETMIRKLLLDGWRSPGNATSETIDAANSIASELGHRDIYSYAEWVRKNAAESRRGYENARAMVRPAKERQAPIAERLSRIPPDKFNRLIEWLDSR